MGSIGSAHETEAEILRTMQALIDNASGGAGATDSAAADFVQSVSALHEIWPESKSAPRSSAGNPDRLISGGEVAPHGESSKNALGHRRLGRFEIKGMLGHGGFGVVLLAFDSTLSRDVALKIPRPALLLATEMRSRFLNEAQAAALLDHPCIVPVHDAGEIGPVWYIAAGYVKGPSLSQWLRDTPGPLASRLCASLVANLADAVQHAHSRGILHRDLKPSNVMLEPIAEPGHEAFPFVPKLTDFGLAKRLESTGDQTLSGMLIGTPRYMAPEQASNRYKEIGVTADVYALGAILHELLCGEPPFVGPSDSDVLQRIQHDALSPSRLRNRMVPKDLETICLKCLDKEIDGRYQTAKELGDDLRRFLADEPVVARPIGSATRLFRWVRRRPLIAALSLGLLVAVTSGVLVGSWQWYRAERHSAQAESNAALAEENLVEAENAIVDLAWLFEESALWAPESVTFRDAVNAKLTKYLERVVSQTDQSQPLRPVLAAVHSFSARHAWLANDQKTAYDNYRLATGYWMQLVEEQPDNATYRRGMSLSMLGFRLFELEWNSIAGTVDPRENARINYRYLLKEWRLGESVLLDLMEVAIERGQAMYGARRMKETIELYEIGQLAAEVLLEQQPDDPRFLFRQGQFTLRLAKEKRRLGEGEDAATMLSAATQSLERALEGSSRERAYRTELAEAYRVRGILAREQKDFVAADRVFTDAVELLDSVLLELPDDYHCIHFKRRVAGVTRELAYVRLSLDMQEDALELFARCRDLWRPARQEKLLPVEEEKELGFVCHREGKLAQELGRPQIARVAFAEGIDVFKLRPRQHNDNSRGERGAPTHLGALSECHFYLGRLQMAAKETEAARANFQTAIELLTPYVKRASFDPALKDIHGKATAKLDELQERDADAAAATTDAQ